MFAIKPYKDLFYQMKLLYRPYINKVNVKLAQYHLYSAQWNILLLLLDEGALTLSQIAQYRNVEKSSISQSVKKLHDQGYVQFIAGKDRREKKAQLTELGNEILNEIQLSIDEIQQSALRGISEEEQLEVGRILTTIRGNISNNCK